MGRINVKVVDLASAQTENIAILMHKIKNTTVLYIMVSMKI
jgi:hypothetical protein